MGHCVAGYAESVASQNYLVYSIARGGERSSTLGINVSELKKKLHGGGESTEFVFRLSQHYGKYNARLSDENEKELGEMIVKALNVG